MQLFNGVAHYVNLTLSNQNQRFMDGDSWETHNPTIYVSSQRVSPTP